MAKWARTSHFLRIRLPLGALGVGCALSARDKKVSELEGMGKLGTCS
jgi:hypothetical protein